MISRRRLLQAGGLGALHFGMPGLVAARVDGSGARPAREKSCIFILLCGGASHLDTWDLKPDAPDEIRGPYRPIATTVPGLRLNELHPRLAKLARHCCVINSMSHPGAISNHFDAMHNCLSGQATPPADAPYMGSILAKLRPSERNVASYVWLIKCVGDPVFCAPNIGTGGSLGAPYSPLFVGSAENNPATPGFKATDFFVESSAERMIGRRKLLDTLERSGSSDAAAVTKGWQNMHRKAFDLATSMAARRAFEVEREDPKIRDRYGRHPLGQNLLLARRLIESGVGFVTVNGWTGRAPNDKGGGPPSSSWDMHGAEMGMGNAFGAGSYGMGWCLPCLDEGLSALLTDLEERGRLENTLVVVATEFGRTPRINQNKGIPGRQHWPICFSTILAGGGIRGGQVYGESDKIGAYVKDRPVRPPDLAATIYHALGVPLDPRLSKDGVTKPITTGQPLLSLFS
ncbi:hypothetical protein AYO40_03670 [Planctomycetaceae bacterium SCGC AG-212-D15]|nr:hypothetical protein AYO40_03670 [Planctomycetaceae bacterium SCGC AG-212-D15]